MLFALITFSSLNITNDYYYDKINTLSCYTHRVLPFNNNNINYDHIFSIIFNNNSEIYSTYPDI